MSPALDPPRREPAAPGDDVAVTCRPTAEGFVCDVRVGSDAGGTRHEVAVSHPDLARLAPGHYDPELLVRASFEFLLAREPREAILRSFPLPVIERYFPGYESSIRARMSAAAESAPRDPSTP